MSRAGPPVLAWAALLTALAVVLYVWTPSDRVQWVSLAAAALATWLFGLVLLLRPRTWRELRFLPDLSMSTVVLALGVASMLNGIVLGLWLVLTGAGLVLLGAAGLVREDLAERRRRPS